MSEEQQPEVQETGYGSRLARMFGYVTPEDRSKWEQQRAQNRRHVSAAKKGVKSTLASMIEFGERNIGSKLDAAHRVAAQKRFEESHDRIVSKHRDPRTRSIVETVDYKRTDDRQEIEPDLEM